MQVRPDSSGTAGGGIQRSLRDAARGDDPRWSSTTQPDRPAAAIGHEDGGDTTTLYGSLLSDYLATRSEAVLYRGSVLSRHLIELGIGPEDIAGLHYDALQAATRGLPFREQARAAADGHQFLLEVLIAYGVQYREYQDRRAEAREREAAEAASVARQRAEEAERTSQVRGELLRAVVHELRTPLTAARAYLQLAARDLAAGDAAHAQDAGAAERAARAGDSVEQALQALDRQARLLANLFEASRSDPPDLGMRPLHLAPLLEQACAWARAGGSGVAVDYVPAAPGEPDEVRGNADALLSVAGNLVGNAQQHSSQGQRVTVRHGVDRASGTVWLEVQDHGSGMPPDVAARVFEPYFRGPDAHGPGLGLGLALVRRLVAAHGGSVAVWSAPGQGSTFRVELPAITEPAAPPPAPAR